ncbi:hypothetical protein [Azorhizophilus paspali]|uniref:Uncharacterized protein n=1 Tax=Azorhizophilus paspali TaxID=69963 RepID=A0ABV6SGW4_AZOPA
MTAPTITALPEAPQRNNAAADYATKADAFAAALPSLVEEINESAEFIEERAAVAESSAESAQEAAKTALLARDAAQAGANFKGAWSSLTGPLGLPATVLHNGQIWSLLTNLPNVTASEPGVTDDWLVQGGLDATKTANFTAARNARYWLPASVTVTLPAIAGMPIGTFVELSSAYAATPVIQTTDGAQIAVGGQVDTAVTYNVGMRLLLIFSGTRWEVMI